MARLFRRKWNRRPGEPVIKTTVQVDPAQLKLDSQMHILRAALDRPHITLVTPNSSKVPQNVLEMVSAGWLTEHRPDAKSVQLTITDAGREQYNRYEQEKQCVEEQS